MMGKKIKLLVYVSTLSEGGAERQISYLLNNLDRNVFDMVLCLSRQKVGYPIPDDITIYYFDKKHFWDLVRITLRLKQIIIENNIDIVFSTLFTCNIACLLQKILIAKKLKLVIREASNPLWYKQKLLSFAYLWPMKALYPFADTIINNSSGAKNALSALIGTSAEKHRVIYNMLDADYIQDLGREKVDYKDHSKNPVVISSGRLDKFKGFEYLLKAIEIVNKTLKVDLLILGEGPELDNLQKLAKDLAISDRVKFLGFQKNPFKYIAQADIFVSATLFESMSNVILEAMAGGIPVVATRIPYGNDEIIEEGQCGFLVPARDPACLAEKIMTLLENPDLRSKFSSQGKKRIKEKFSIEKGIKAFENVFLALYNEKTNRSN